MNTQALTELAAAFDLSEADIEDEANRHAARVRGLVELWQSNGQAPSESKRALQAFARRHHVELPAKQSLTQLLNRTTAAPWWRRALRKRLRTVEHQAIQRGAVHRHASPYVSAKALRRHEADVKRLAALIASLEVMNTATGEVLALEEVIEASRANPRNRRVEMMLRIKGIEAQAKSKGHEAVFLTITAPSRMHVRHHTGQPIEQHDGSSPRQVQTYLHGLWRRAMRSMQRDGLTPYGMRTVEPHHDGCPHWHVLLFAPADQTAAILTTLRAHALADTPGEPGAQERRFKVERIDPAKGSALAYVAKYVSKSIDGFGVDTDVESSGSGTDTARRVVAWARLWGVRQFQFFGLPPITPMRELFRHDGDTPACIGLEDARQAAKSNDHAGYLAACEAHRLGFDVLYTERPSTRYADELSQAIRGLLARAPDLSAPLELTTRTETWCIQPRQAPQEGAVRVPWDSGLGTRDSGLGTRDSIQ